MVMIASVRFVNSSSEKLFLAFSYTASIDVIVDADTKAIRGDLDSTSHGYLPPPMAIEYLRGLRMDWILVCGTQADTCVLAGGVARRKARYSSTLQSLRSQCRSNYLRIRWRSPWPRGISLGKSS